ncbi:hypothetical protein ACFQU1_16985 [Chelatococcus sp. GCM10030263]|uniref:hypothetical protein n=1 Tax=Chelatococcus sp. GCM10030263 TaxID=3273387 RepID=UPI00361E5323
MAKVPPLVRGAAKRIARAAGVMPPKNAGPPSRAVTHMPRAEHSRRGMPALDYSSMEDSFDQPSTSSSYDDALVPWGLSHIAPYAEELLKVHQKDLKGFFYIPLRLKRRIHREEYKYEGKEYIHNAYESNVEHGALIWNKWRTVAGKAPYEFIIKPDYMSEKRWLRSEPLKELDPATTKLYILLENVSGYQNNKNVVIGGNEAPICGLGPFGCFTSGQRLWNAKEFADHLKRCRLNEAYCHIRFYVPFSICYDSELAEKFATDFVKEMHQHGYDYLRVRVYRGEPSFDYKELSNGRGFHRYARYIVGRDRWEEGQARPKELSFEIKSSDVDSRSNAEKTIDLVKDGCRNAKKKIKKAKNAIQQKAASQVLGYGYSHIKKKHLT